MKSDVESLRLVAHLADRAPSSLWRSGAAQSLPAVFQAAVTAATANPTATTEESMEALIQAIVFCGNASSKGDECDLQIDPNCFAAQLGQSCLVPVLEWMAAAAVYNTNDTDIWCKCMQHLSHAASTCPSLLAGDTSTFLLLIRVCMMQHSDDTARLSSLEVLATICQVGDVKRKRLSALTPEGLALQKALLVGENCNDASTNNSDSGGGVIYICATLIAKGVDDDIEGWATDPATLLWNNASASSASVWEEDDVALHAEALLESLLQNVGGGSQSLPVVLPLVETLLADSNNWKHQRAALSILERCLEAAPVTFSRHVPIAMETALTLLSKKDCNIRVQYQAMNLLGALCEADNNSDGKHTQQESVRRQYGPRILQAISQSCQSPCTKVASVACLSIVSYCRGGDISSVGRETMVVPYLKDILMALVAGPLSLEVGGAVAGSEVNIGAVTVKVRAIGAVACLAEAAAEAFVPFYGNVMPGLLACAQLQVSTTSNTHELSLLRGASIEAATIIGQATSEANRDMFVPDAEQIMKLALPLLNQASTLASAAVIIPMDQLLAACARIASVMGEAYAPFIQSVLPHLLNRANEPPDVSVTNGDEAGLDATRRGDRNVDPDEGTESMTVALPGRGLTKVTINTTKMQEKALAARAVYEHAQALGAAFGPYVLTSLTTFLPLISFQYSAEVRATATQATAAIYEASCAYAATSAYAAGSMEVPQRYLALLGDAISKQILAEETDDTMETIYALADSLSEIYYSAYSRLEETQRQIIANFSIENAHTTVSVLMKATEACLTRRAKITRTIQGHDGALTGEDELEEYNDLLNCEQELLSPLVDCVGYTLKFFKESFVPIFDAHVAPVLAPLLVANVDVRARFAAVCLFDDCIEHCGSVAAAKHSRQLGDGIAFALGNAAIDQDSELLRVAVYGIAQIARYAPSDALAPHVQTMLPLLINICKGAKADVDDVFLVENAISALASLILIGKAPFKNVQSKDTILQTFVHHLPLSQDEDEAKVRRWC